MVFLYGRCGISEKFPRFCGIFAICRSLIDVLCTRVAELFLVHQSDFSNPLSATQRTRNLVKKRLVYIPLSSLESREGIKSIE